MMDGRRLLPRLALLLVLAGAAAWAVLNRDNFDAAAIEAAVRGIGPLGPAAFAAAWVVGTLLFFPGAVLGLAGGALFGPVWGTVWNLTGATIGATLAFLLARYLAGDWVARRAGGRLKRLLDGVEQEGWRFVALTRLVPLFPFNLLNYALGLTRIGFGPFVVTTLVCMLPGTFAYTWLGYAGREAIAGGESLVQKILLGIGLLAIVAFLPRLIRRFRRGRPVWTDAGTLRQELDRGAGLSVIDVRGAEEFDGPGGHIEGSRNIPLGEIEGRLDEVATDRAQPVVLVCKTDKRSAQAAAILRNAGFSEVRVLRGGMDRWVTSDREAEPASASGDADLP